MSRLISLKYHDVTKRLTKIGFRFYRHGKGSHEIGVRNTDGKVIPVPKHKSKDIKTGTLKSTINETGLNNVIFSNL